MKKILFLIVLFSASSCYASIEDVFNSVCKIEKTIGKKVGGGTGTIFHIDADNLWILTAGHVLDKTVDCKVIFYNGGFESPKFSAVVDCIDFNNSVPSSETKNVLDLCILKVAKKDLGTWPLPSAIKIDRKAQIDINLPVISIGCPKLAWPSAFFGHIFKIQPENMKFLPEPIPGRSGSGIFDKNGDKLIGVVIWAGDGGTALSINDFARHLNINEKLNKLNA